MQPSGLPVPWLIVMLPPAFGKRKSVVSSMAPSTRLAAFEFLQIPVTSARGKGGKEAILEYGAMV